MKVIETERLRLTEVQESDRAGFIRFFGTPEVMAIRKFGVLDEGAASKAFDDMLAHWQSHDFGMFAVRTQGEDALMGECGLRYREDGETVEISYGLFPEHWGGGLIPEASKAMLAYGFKELGLRTIYALGREDNARSRRVMEKLGLRHIETFAGTGKTVVKYRIDSPRVEELTEQKS